MKPIFSKKPWKTSPSLKMLNSIFSAPTVTTIPKKKISTKRKNTTNKPDGKLLCTTMRDLRVYNRAWRSFSASRKNRFIRRTGIIDIYPFLRPKELCSYSTFSPTISCRSFLSAAALSVWKSLQTLYLRPLGEGAFLYFHASTGVRPAHHHQAAPGSDGYNDRLHISQRLATCRSRISPGKDHPSKTRPIDRSGVDQSMHEWR